jgi:hypothetical protein
LTEKELFERRFLIFADERDRVALARDMIDVLRQDAVANAGNALSVTSIWSKPKSNRKPLSWMPAPSNPVTRYAVAAAALLVVGGVFWLLFETTRLHSEIDRLRAESATAQKRSAEEGARVGELDKQLQAERDRRAQLEQEISRRDEQTDQLPSRPAISLFLLPGRIRGGGETTRLVLPPGVDEVRLRLGLSGDISSSYRAVVMNADGEEIWTRAALSARRDGARTIIGLGIPASILAVDDYELRLTGLDNAGEAERSDSYYFRVVKK